LAQMKFFYELTISSSPHAHSKDTTQTIMRDVLIALTPALIGSVCFFGFRALLVTLLSGAACALFEWLYRKIMKLDSTVYDLSAVVTGVLIAFVCPVTVPFWVILIGDFFAIIVVKQLFGGIGKNFMNPALAARAFLFSWPVVMSTWVEPGFSNAVGIFQTDAVSSATPLVSEEGVTLLNLLIGNVGGCMGETSALLLLIGFAYLWIRKVVTPRIPLAFIGTVAVIAMIFPQGHNSFYWAAYQVLSGGVMLGALFMATDYVTSPVTKWGQVIFGIGCGAITMAIRYLGAYPEGVSYAILVMNACVVMLDRIGRPVKFGTPKKEAAKK